MDPVDVESRIFLTRNTSIYEFPYLVHEDWILKKNRSLSPNSSDYLVKGEMKVLTDIRQSKGPRAIHSRLAMDVDDS